MRFEHRRALTFALIHAGICALLILWSDAREWDRLRPSNAPSPVLKDPPPPPPGPNPQTGSEEEESVGFSPDCRSMWFYIPLQDRIVNFFEFPASTLTGWHHPCTAPWMAAQFLHSYPERGTQRAELIDASVLLLLIVLQWSIIGGLPLVHPSVRMLEPGYFLTAALIIVAPIAPLAAILEAFRFPWIEAVMLVPGILGLLALALGLIAWLAWPFLLIWNLVKSCMRIASRRFATPLKPRDK